MNLLAGGGGGLSSLPGPPAERPGKRGGTHIVGVLNELDHVAGILRQLPDGGLGDDVCELLPGEKTGGRGQNPGAKGASASSQFRNSPEGSLPA